MGASYTHTTWVRQVFLKVGVSGEAVRAEAAVLEKRKFEVKYADSESNRPFCVASVPT